jgi:hypothetical protein
MTIIREGSGQIEPAHEHKGNVIDDPGICGLASTVGCPGGNLILWCGSNQAPARCHLAVKVGDKATRGKSRCGVAALLKDEVSGDKSDVFSIQLLVGSPCGSMPLIGAIPKCDQPDCIEKYVIHG